MHDTKCLICINNWPSILCSWTTKDHQEIKYQKYFLFVPLSLSGQIFTAWRWHHICHPVWLKQGLRTLQARPPQPYVSIIGHFIFQNLLFYLSCYLLGRFPPMGYPPTPLQLFMCYVCWSEICDDLFKSMILFGRESHGNLIRENWVQLASLTSCWPSLKSCLTPDPRFFVCLNHYAYSNWEAMRTFGHKLAALASDSSMEWMRFSAEYSQILDIGVYSRVIVMYYKFLTIV